MVERRFDWKIGDVNFESKFSSAFVHFGGRTLGAKDIREDEKGIIIIRDLCSSWKRVLGKMF